MFARSMQIIITIISNEYVCERKYLATSISHRNKNNFNRINIMIRQIMASFLIWWNVFRQYVI